MVRDQASQKRPSVIFVETHGGMYVNPYTIELLAWMDNHSYALWYKDKSDSVFVLKDSIPLSLSDSVRLICTNIRLALRTRRKKLKRALKRLFKF